MCIRDRYDPESYSDNSLYKGIKVNHPVMNDSLRRSGNPMLILYTLKKTFVMRKYVFFISD